MSKLPWLLLIAGLATGLWLGFNPTTHRELVRFWNNATKTSETHARPIGSLDLRQLDRKVNGWFRSTARVQAQPLRPSSLPIWKQVSAGLEAFWNAIQRFLASMISDTGKAGS